MSWKTWARVLVCAGASIASACSSGGGRLSGKDASAETAGADDGGDGNANDGLDAAADTASAMTPEEVCRAALTAECQRYGACGQQPSTDDCLFAVAGLCPYYYFNADSLRTTADAMACVAAFAQEPCTDLHLGIFPSCLALGTKPSGASCVYNSQCRSGACASANRRCGTCLSAAAGAGEPCGDGRYCVRQAFCHPVSHICELVSTIVHAAEGEHCDLQADPMIGCVGDLTCAGSAASGVGGTCKHYPKAGEPCFSSVESLFACAEGFACDDGGKCWPVDTCGGTMTCDPAAACVRTNGRTMCVPRSGEGAACAADGLAPCDATTICSADPTGTSATGICTRFVPKGAACDATHQCAGVLSCLNGACEAIDPASCDVARM
jgi:hypothetical protein